MKTETIAQIDNDARMIAAAEVAAAKAEKKQPRQVCKPATAADFSRLAEQAVTNGVVILKAPNMPGYFALSGSTPGLIYPVDPVGGCACQGFQRVARCQHHSYLLAILGQLPEDPEPEPIAPAAAAAALPAVPAEAAPFVAELIAMRRPWDDLARSIAYGKRAEIRTKELADMLAAARDMRTAFDTICNQAASYGVSRDLLRDVWRRSVPAPSPMPGASATAEEGESIAELEAAMIAAREKLEEAKERVRKAEHQFELYRYDDYTPASTLRDAIRNAETMLDTAEREYDRAARHYTIAANGDDYAAAIAA